MRLVRTPLRGRARFRAALLFALASAALRPTPAAAQTPTYTWGNVGSTLTENWSVSTNWVGNVIPSGSPTTILQFNAVGTASYTATNNFAGTFSLNGFLLNSNSISTISINSVSGSTLQLTGTNPFFNQIGPGSVTFGSAAGLSLNPSSGTTTIGGSGPGNLTFSGVIAGTGGLTINQTGTGIVSFTAANTFTGGVTLQSGNLSISGTALGTNTLTVNGGTFRSTGTITPNIVLNADLVYTGTGTTTIGNATTSANAISGTGGFQLLGVATVDFEQTHTYTGATVVGPTAVVGTTPGAFGNLASNAALQLSGTGGSIASSPAVTINLGTLTLGTTGLGTNNDRVGDSTPVTLNRGTLRLNATNASVFETIGSLSGSGYSVVDVQSAGANTTVLQANSFNRVGRGTFAFTGTGLGSGTGSSVFFNATPTLVGAGGSAGGTNLSIVPFAVGGLGNAAVPNSLVTYDTGGIRPLDLTAEYAAYAGATAADNVRVTAAAIGLAGQTVNALVIDNSTTGAFAVTGTGTLVLGSGALLFSGSQPTTLGGFSGVGAGSGGELVVHVTNTSAGVTLSAPLAASVTAGLTKSGPGALFLTAANSHSGGTTVNGGSLFVTADNQFGTGGVTLAGGTLQYTGPTATLAAGRSFTLSGVGGGIGVASGSTLTVPGALGGSGDLYKTGQGTLVLTNTNNAAAATGRTVITSGVVAISSAAALPGGVVALEPAGSFGGATLQFLASAAFSKTITVNSPSVGGIVSGWIDTNGFSVTHTGTLANSVGGSNNVSLVKVGAGTLSYTSSQPFAGQVAVAGGTLTLVGGGALPNAIPSVVAGGTLTLDNANSPLSNRLRDGVLTLSGGNLNLLGSPLGAVTEMVGNLTLSSFTANTITMTPGGGATTVAAATLTASGNGVLLVRGSGLGATPGAGSSNLLFTVNAPTQVGGFGATGTPTLSILPRFYADTTSSSGAGTDLVTYETVRGVRPLTAAEYAPGVTSGSSVLNNVKLTAVATADDPTVVNALVLNGGGGVGGAGVLTVNSGTILAATGNAGVSAGVLSFGSAVGSVRTTGNLAIGSALVGGGGLTKSGAGTLTVNGVVNVGDSLAIAEGGVVLGPAAVVSPNTRVTVLPGTSLDLGGVSRTLGSLSNPVFGPTAALPPLGAGSTVSLGAGTLTLADPTSPTFSGTVTGTGGLTIQSFANGAFPGQTTLLGTNIYSGPTTVLQGSLIVAGAGGSIANSPAITVAGGTLALDEGSTFVSNLGNLPTFNPNPRINPGDPISLAGALVVIGHQTLGKNVTVGPLTVTGGAAVVVSPGPLPIGTTVPASAAGTTLTFPSLTRTNNAAVLFSGANLGNPPAPGVANIFFTTPPAGLVGGGGPAGSTAVSILPYATGSAAAFSERGGTFVTYDPAVGVRPLNTATEYAAYAAAGATDNVRTTASLTGQTGKAINSLLVDFSGTAGTTLTLSGTGTLTVQSGAVLFAGTSTSTGTSANSLTVSGFAGLNLGAEGVITVANATVDSLGTTQNLGTVTVSVPITANTLTKGFGSGTLVLSGNNSGSLAGGLTVTAGAVSFAADTNLGAAGAPVTMGGMSVVGTSGLTTGNVYNTDGGGPRLLYTGTTGLTLSRPVTVTAGIATFDTQIGTLRLGGAITGAGGVAAGLTGGTVNLTPTTPGTHTYTGPTRVVGGTLQFTDDTDLGTGGPVHIDGGTVVLLGNWTTNRGVFVTATATLNTGAFNAALNGPVAGTFGSTGATLTKTGTGTLTLAGVNSFNAALTVSQGVVSVQTNTGLGSPLGGTTIGSGAELQLQGGITVAAEPLTASGTGVTGAGAFRSVSGNNVWTGPVTLNAATTVGVDAGRLTVDGAIGGSVGMTKVGGGTLNLLAANTYTGGTTVNAGTLLVNNTTAGSGTGSGAVTVNTGGTLGGAGAISGAVTVNTGATLAPGNGPTPGVLTVGSATFNSGSTFSVKLNGTTAGTQYDQLRTTAAGTAVTLTGAALTGTFGYAPQPTDALTVVSTPGGTVTGQFAGGTSFAFGGYTGTVQYNPDSVVLTGFTPVPEPAHVLLVCVGAAAGLARWRRRVSARAT
jgi:autotransporter-associated beta strand protein